MIDLYYWPTPNGWKISIALEELGLPYTLRLVNIGRGEQHQPAFLAISPNGRMPAIVDQAPPGGGEPISIFESGAILSYLAEKTGRLGGSDLRSRVQVDEWLFWQVGGLGPMAGQSGHFSKYAPEKIPYAIERYGKEVQRLFGVMDRRLAEREYLAGEYSIADIASFPWVHAVETMSPSLASFPNLARWHGAILARDAVQRGLALSKDAAPKVLDDEARKALFGTHDGK